MHDDAPFMTPLAIFYLRLYARVKRWGSLPKLGGILEQDEKTMRILDTIDDLAEEHAELERKLQEQRVTNAKALGGAGRTIRYVRR